MGTCFFVLLFLLAGLFTVATAVRWFEQTAEAVDQRWWNKLTLLVLMPFAVWLFPSRVTAGRPSAVPRHEPVRGFGGLPKGGIAEPVVPIAPPTGSPPTSAAPTSAAPTGTAPTGTAPTGTAPTGTAPMDGPPPGTPKEFLGMPTIPPKRAASRPAIDPEKLAKLRQKMKEQGMLDEEQS